MHKPAILIAIWLMIGLGSAAQAPSRWRPAEQRAAGGLVARPEAGVQAAPLPQATIPAGYGDCTRIAYQSWLADNWEILSARGDGSQPVRLTADPAADEGPSLGPGGERLAFASRRHGNYDLYTMRYDGAELTRLMTDPADDTLPDYHPDGAQLAFQSKRDAAEYELYRLPEGGGTPTRLTTDNAYDGQPDWSPDGRQIVFISARSGARNVWVMDADGANPRQLSSLPYAGGPKWSPDGRTIAFAADDLNNGFVSLWVMNADGSGARLVWRPAVAQTDAWPNAWSPDGRYILYEETRWTLDEASWYVVSSSLEAINPTNTADRAQLVGNGVHMAGSWVSSDVQPPSSQVGALPLTGTLPLTVTWTGSDACSRPVEYQIQYRAGGVAAWSDWPVTPDAAWTDATQARFSAAHAGQVVYFRSRARDAVGNIETWPSGAGDASAAFPAAIAGRVNDVRGLGLPQATVSGPAPRWSTAHAGRNGYYLLQAVAESACSLTATAMGYRSASISRPALDHMIGVGFTLSAGPEWVENGGFEVEAVGWYASGKASVEERSDSYGSAAARLGGAALNANPETLAALPAFWQEVAIPANAHAPTLSFRYALGNGDGAPVGTLRALVANGGDETTVATISAATPWGVMADGVRYPLWQQVWADLTPWAGQTITLTLRYDPGWSQQGALLDEVSLGPWLTPRVDRVTPAYLAPGQGGQITVEGANFLTAGEGAACVRVGALDLATTYLSETRLTATLPPTLPIGLYEVTVRNPEGQEGALTNGRLTVGGVVAAPMVRNR